ncbi:hypothetical protein HOL21_02855 [Candidatus Woesearchaeota archaeon]|jgi:hypothetical protein|nr:hypothetical protein [Candidatus Woesearchaeota archaeon]MBT5397128.1 hypothetical protein [Candidatus Woesearchaeota archaeon]MBT6367326.1 hypothetical protein [Candidatus Woesearchaeota archaeon]MBT7762528.1 hypothetical protein [Candidatus Woesearchaeota archaeon]
MKLQIMILIVCLFIVACVPAEKQCSTDTDCVKATCCHASSSVNKEFAPECQGQICTLECVEGTTDCGYGDIKCISGSCEVVLK